MWDTAELGSTHLSHDMPCPGCAHPRHTYLPCSDECACVPQWPGTMPATTTLATSRLAEVSSQGWAA
ncbi:hypothetical protein ISU10_10785 [Nocardioides agariphilus]|jgi:hypothetical protein|uniref:Uncharacterized protein n=1 Tax=Nocardioides agariphilus TaxID=433664 RepID=A0A930YQ07_9ACTN|nr:hypothetical protein [Nocardioides agariphilus]MBF4768255.1 hypothetical protein [Nocardioides agariphilus]